jgi:hypothetical protein
VTRRVVCFSTQVGSALTLLLGCLLPRGLPAQVPQAPEDARVALGRYGRLALTTYSIHGPAPLILLMTQARALTSRGERIYRRTFTRELTDELTRRGFSYFVLSESADSVSPDQPPERVVELLHQDARSAVELLGRLQAPPAAVVGIGEGAIAAALLTVHDSHPRVLAALAPSVPPIPGATVARAPRWDEVIQALGQRLPYVLAVQSVCDGPLPAELLTEHRYPRRFLLLPQYDGWLAPLAGPECPTTPPDGRLPDFDVARLVVEWIGSSVRFPE